MREWTRFPEVPSSSQTLIPPLITQQRAHSSHCFELTSDFSWAEKVHFLGGGIRTSKGYQCHKYSEGRN